MRESEAYQEILEEGEEIGLRKGREEGELLNARRMVLKAGLRRLGQPSPEVEARVNALVSLTVLESLIDRVFDVETWDELLAGL